ncbi:hypothetical protein [Aeromicrobium sp. UC242_57]|uniref:hypothetical protein n=1 Tax=Aeromicrobium sp. UC242_57 TaxID=3374624 RepID=UPI0037877B6E
MFYPESTTERCTAALLLEVDPIALVKGKGAKQQAFSLGSVRQRPPLCRVVAVVGRDGQGLPHRVGRTL